MINFQPIKPDEIFSLYKEFSEDPRKEKINGGIGVYLNDAGNPFVLPVVKKTIKLLNFNNFNYLPIAGDRIFLEETAKLFLGDKLYNRSSNLFAKQGVNGGTNGLYVIGSLIKEIDKNPRLILSKPTWENHLKIFSYLGFSIIEYKHIDEQLNFNFDSLVKIISHNPSAYLLLQGGLTHNPTGVNPNSSQWEKLITLFKKNRNHIIFDFAYMGLGESIDKDSWPIRLCVENGLPVSVIISYSKNMTLYQHRTGAIFFSCNSSVKSERAENNLQKIFRLINSNPSAFGELVVKNILENKLLKKEWIYEVGTMVESLDARRRLFVKYAGKRFKHLLLEKGLFSLLDLSKPQIEKLKKESAIYLLSNSRINFGGISEKNIPKVAKAVWEILC